MKQFKIFENPQLGHREAVKQGWSWPAFFFNWIWAFLNKLNARGAGVLGVYFAVGFLSGMTGDDGGDVLDTLMGLASIIIAVVFGVNGNAWREKNLLKRGFQLKGNTEAGSADAALALYAQRLQPTSAAA